MNDREEKTRHQTLLTEDPEPNSEELQAALDALHPADLARALDSMEDVDRKLAVFALLPVDEASETIRQASDVTREELVERLSDSRVTALVEGLDTDDAADLLSHVPEERRRALLERTSPDMRRDVGELLTYPEDSAGGLMKTEVAAVSAEATIGQTTEYMRRHAEDFHDVHNVFVTGQDGALLGFVPIRQVLLADDAKTVGEVMNTDLVSVQARVDQEEVAHLFERYDLLSLPVVDALGRLVGRITVDDIVDVIEEEATEDMLKLAGVGDEPLAPVGPLQAMRSRLPWLALNLLTATLSAATVALFEDTIREVAVAAALMTIVASQGGNAAVQTMTLTVRGLALGEVRASQAWKILGSEYLTALGNGTFLGLAAGFIAYIWRGDLGLSVVLASAMLVNLLVAATAGSLVPLGLKALKIDPAVSSAVLVTTATDLLGFFAFLGLLSLTL